MCSFCQIYSYISVLLIIYHIYMLIIQRASWSTFNFIIDMFSFRDITLCFHVNVHISDFHFVKFLVRNVFCCLSCPLLTTSSFPSLYPHMWSIRLPQMFTCDFQLHGFHYLLACFSSQLPLISVRVTALMVQLLWETHLLSLLGFLLCQTTIVTCLSSFGFIFLALCAIRYNFHCE